MTDFPYCFNKTNTKTILDVFDCCSNDLSTNYYSNDIIETEEESILTIGKKSGEELDKIVEEQWIQKKLEESLPVYAIVDKLPEEGDENKVYIVMDHNDFSTYIYKDGGFEEVLRNSYKDYEEDDDGYIITNKGTDFPLPLDIL